MATATKKKSVRGMKVQLIKAGVKERFNRFCDSLEPPVGYADMATHVLDEFLKEQGR